MNDKKVSAILFSLKECSLGYFLSQMRESAFSFEVNVIGTCVVMVMGVVAEVISDHESFSYEKQQNLYLNEKGKTADLRYKLTFFLSSFHFVSSFARLLLRPINKCLSKVTHDNNVCSFSNSKMLLSYQIWICIFFVRRKKCKCCFSFDFSQ